MWYDETQMVMFFLDFLKQTWVYVFEGRLVESRLLIGQTVYYVKGH